jgi:hypothetical protein
LSDKPTERDFKIDPNDPNIIIIKPTTLVCASHGEHLRDQWPSGFMTVGISLFQAAVASPRLTREARRVAKRPIGKLQHRVLNQVFAKKPMCYFCTREEIRQAFIDADLLTKQRCDVCGHIDLAGPYTMQMPGGELKTEIVCIECMLDGGEREHAAYPKGPPPRD